MFSFAAFVVNGALEDSLPELLFDESGWMGIAQRRGHEHYIVSAIEFSQSMKMLTGPFSSAERWSVK